jgi:WD40 repeat protein
MGFNKQNHDILVIGYGSVTFGDVKPGRLCFWNLKNPHHPMMTYECQHSVTSLDFSSEFPHFLACGFYNGGVAIYDIRDPSGKPTMESVHPGKHSEAVWNCKWVSKDKSTNANEQVVSISSDGTVMQWSIKKGLTPRVLMELPRISNKAHFNGGAVEGLSREASGLCFDFPINDGTQYYAGTEDGLLHLCSVSYNEQTLENYYGHTAAVYRVKCSPFLPHVFLSCSADWTCLLWNGKEQGDKKWTMRFQSGFDYVTAIDWSPHNSCVFASVCRDGFVHIWDIKNSPVDPILSHHFPNKQLCSVTWAPDAPVVIVGALDGTSDCFHVANVEVSKEETAKWSAADQAMRLDEAMKASSDDSAKKGGKNSADGGRSGSSDGADGASSSGAA